MLGHRQLYSRDSALFQEAEKGGQGESVDLADTDACCEEGKTISGQSAQKVTPGIHCAGARVCSGSLRHGRIPDILICNTAARGTANLLNAATLTGPAQSCPDHTAQRV